MTDPDPDPDPDPDHGDRLAALFRDAAADPPPSAFDHDRVVATSRRITRRRRAAVLGGAVALLVVAGVGVAVAVPRGSDAATAAAPAPDVAAESAPGRASPGQAAPGEPAPGQPVPAEAEPAPADALAAPAEVPDAVAEAFTGAPLGPGTAPCADRQDPQLRVLVEQVLPEVTGAPEAGITMECRPPGERGVNLEVDDAGTPGLLTVLYLPPGAAADAAYDGATAATASGGTVVVSSRPGGPTGTVPFAGRLDKAAAYLAPRL